MVIVLREHSIRFPHLLCVPISEFSARVMINDGSGEIVVMGIPPDMANTPPIRSGYGSPETSWRQSDMLEVYSRVLKCRRPVMYQVMRMNAFNGCEYVENIFHLYYVMQATPVLTHHILSH